MAGGEAPGGAATGAASGGAAVGEDGKKLSKNALKKLAKGPKKEKTVMKSVHLLFFLL